MHKLIAIFLFIIVAIACPHSNFASHLRAGEITARRISCLSYAYEITITAYIDTESGVAFGGLNDWLDFGDGSEKLLVKETRTTPRPDLGEHMGVVIFKVTHVYGAGASEYRITYSEEFRNKFVVNIDQSDATPFFLETVIYLDPCFDCNANLPVLGSPPIDRACTGVAFFHNPSATDADGDSLSYELTIPKMSENAFVRNYKDPHDVKFYSDYNTGNEMNSGAPDFSIDPFDGTLLWDAPGMAGEYNIAFRVIEWRKDCNGIWQKMSYVTRDMQIIVEDCDNNRPYLILPEDTCVVAGTLLEKTIYGSDPDGDDVKIEVFSEVLGLESPATYEPSPPAYQVSGARLFFTWATTCGHVKEQYYHVVFKITDRPVDGPKLVTFQTWRIKVVAPPPEWKDATLDLVNRSANLTWENYMCTNATTMQVWRKIDGDPYVPAVCETGMPNLGYTLVGAVVMKDTATNEVIQHFIDTNAGAGLAPGARYCYRLVAIFPDPKGGESYVSKDTCLAPILADAPVITHVSVEQTHLSEGAITVSWYSPFEIDRSQFPGPYQYEVYRASGFTGNDFVIATPSRVTDTTFTDIALNTESTVYNYRIVLYSNTSTDPTTWIAVDTSAAASSVWVNIETRADEIALHWQAEVPWTNQSAEFPYHRIYRGTESDAEEDFALIDSVHTSSGSFTYRDHGQYNNIPLDKNTIYCYRVLTRGTYGNPKIRAPLENFSQRICGQPDDEVKPCVPELHLTIIDCDELFLTSQCQVKEFSNRISWSTACSDDSKRFRVYVAANPDKDFVLLADNIRDTFYIDNNLPSFARCYKITAIDAQGNESDKSEMVCSDNCPYFELPNVFTPNGDECNEYFSAYGPFNPKNRNAPESCIPGYVNYEKCIRFVKHVSFRVFNRWGKEVFRQTDFTGENDQYVNWDGRDNNGEWLSSGVYYYLVTVSFDTIDPAKQNKTMKGWVQVVR